MTIRLALLIAIITTAFPALGDKYMATNEQVVQAIADLQTRLAAAEAAAQQARDETTRLQTQFATALPAGGQPAPPQQPQYGAQSSLIDTRLIGKPGIFSGTQESWADWAFVFKAYCAALNPRLITLLNAAQSEQTQVFPKDDTDISLSAQLYYVLCLSVKDRALEKLRAAPVANGLEVWRLFCDEWEPRQRMRFTAMLTSILRVELKDPVLPALELWERAVREYEQQSGETVSDSIRASVLSSSVANPKIREHLALNASRLPDCVAVRGEIVKIVQAQRRWTSIDGDPTAEPMEVDALGKGKGKTKSKGKPDDKGSWKGKSKDGGDKGKGKGGGKTSTRMDDKETRTCHYCQKTGHLAAACRKKARDEARDGKKVAAITPGSASPPALPGTTVGSLTYAQDVANATAHLAQQALEARRSTAGRPVFEIAALTPGTPPRTSSPRYDWPDTDDELTIFALTPKEQVDSVNSPPGDDEEIWALYDSGSGLTTCPADRFVDVELIAGTHPCSLEAATGDAVRPIGRRRVHFLDEAAEHLAIDFTVTNVTKIIIAADALVERGYVATLSREDSYLEHPQRGRITLHRFGRTFWMKLRRVTTQGNLVVAGVARAIRE